jgi:transcriptional regulator with XRE-family HTH domain
MVERERLSGNASEVTVLAEEFAEWFRAELAARDLTQEAVARSLDVSWKTVQRWATARGVPSYEQLVKLYALWGELPPSLH